MDARLPAHLEVSGMIRRIESEGGFGMVIRKGERDAGTLLIVLQDKGENPRLYERMPDLDGTRKWHCSKVQNTENKQDFQDYLDRRLRQDPDSWLIELDIPNGERFIGIG